MDALYLVDNIAIFTTSRLSEIDKSLIWRNRAAALLLIGPPRHTNKIKENPMRIPNRFTGSIAGFLILFALTFVPQSAFARGDIVNFSEGSAGTIVIKTGQRRLYYVLGGGKAVRYPVGVGRAGMQWQGSAFITSTRLKPAWSPPSEMIRENPRLPRVIAGGASNNPMGAAALTLSNGEYAIHGTNAPGTIGGFVSHGCIRMHNADIMDLYSRVHIGTPVTVTR